MQSPAPWALGRCPHSTSSAPHLFRRCPSLVPFPRHRKLHPRRCSDQTSIFFLDCCPFPALTQSGQLCLQQSPAGASVSGLLQELLLCLAFSDSLTVVQDTLQPTISCLDSGSSLILPSLLFAQLVSLFTTQSLGSSHKLSSFKSVRIGLFSKPSNTSEFLRRKSKTLRKTMHVSVPPVHLGRQG